MAVFDENLITSLRLPLFMAWLSVIRLPFTIKGLQSIMRVQLILLWASAPIAIRGFVVDPGSYESVTDLFLARRDS